jgi:hypothetical protein
MHSILLSYHYWPSIAWFAALWQAERVCIDPNELYQKQSYRNRSYILSSQKTDVLSVPIVGSNKRIPMKDVLLDHSTQWPAQHWRSIRTCYGKAPFFDYYAEEIESAYQNPPEGLLAWNQQLLTICLNLLKWEPLSSKMTISPLSENKADFVDMRTVLHPKIAYHNLTYFQSVPYYQQFGKEFVPNLSILDLLMNEGPMAASVIKKSIR